MTDSYAKTDHGNKETNVNYSGTPNETGTESNADSSVAESSLQETLLSGSTSPGKKDKKSSKEKKDKLSRKNLKSTALKWHLEKIQTCKKDK